MVSCTRGRATSIVLAACALLSVAIKAPQLLAPIGQDQGLYNATAERVQRRWRDLVAVGVGVGVGLGAWVWQADCRLSAGPQ